MEIHLQIFQQVFQLKKSKNLLIKVLDYVLKYINKMLLNVQIYSMNNFKKYQSKYMYI